MLELQKFVLQQVSDNETLFKKELVKTLKWINCSEAVELQKWVISKFGNLHPEVIDEVFEVVEMK